MKIGAVFPQTEIGDDPGAIREYTLALEEMGVDYVLAYDHVIGADPTAYPDRRFVYTDQDAFHEPFVLFSFMAGITRRLSFVTGILILPQRNAVLVAKQAAALDVLSGGRLRLGVGVGWNRAEMEAQGFDFRTRGWRSAEQVRVMRALWSEPLVTFEGEFHTIHAMGLNPLPVQRPIPVWFGGGADPVLRRLARYGAGWIPASMAPAQAEPIIENIHRYFAEAGRSPTELGIDVRINLNRQPRAKWESYVTGWRKLGATHIALNTMGNQFASVDEHLAALRDFATFMQNMGS
ncbi:MAG: LLM class F420-dependent oxidoreductase [Chloroflexi bacterium]|nr:LLM class F420-dependent oxidoreductase [Chloroflexota bacterium]